jgi:hypothetical protein
VSLRALFQLCATKLVPVPAWYQTLWGNKATLDFEKEFETFQHLAGSSAYAERFDINRKDLYPCLNDRSDRHEFDPHYINHTAWAARKLASLRPPHHVDISSYLYFSTIVSAFIPVTYYDYRPAALELDNLTTAKADLTNLPFPSNSLSSLSCMHVVEHIGLGRYGDPINPDADLVAMGELQRCLAVRGHLLFVVPIGTPRVCFNAHRVYSKKMICDAMDLCELLELALIPDNTADPSLVYGPNEQLLGEQRYGCGCFLFQKHFAS